MKFIYQRSSKNLLSCRKISNKRSLTFWPWFEINCVLFELFEIFDSCMCKKCSKKMNELKGIKWTECLIDACLEYLDE